MADNGIAFEIVSRVNPAVKAINRLAKGYDNLATSATKAKGAVGGAIPSVTASSITRTGSAAKQAGDHAKNASGKFGMLLASLKRVAFYRAIRTALKEVTQAFQEGTNNLYYYSQALNNLDSAHASGTMNEFATTALYVKNSLGAALMPILQSLVPVVNAIADAFVWATNAVNQFFHALKGESVFTKAKRYATDYAEALGGASGAAKELKKQIFGFDELNIFNSPSGGGGGGASGLDYSGMFEEAEISGIFKKIRDTVEKNLGTDFAARFKVNFKDILFNWKDLNEEQVAQKMLTGFYALLGGVAGFAIGGPMGAIVGSLLGVGLGVYFSTIDFNGDGKITYQEAAAQIKDVAGTLTGAAVGWIVGGPGGALIGAIVGTGLTALIKTFVPKAGVAQVGATFMGGIIGVLAYAAKHPGLAIKAGTAIGLSGAAIGLAATGGLMVTLMSLANLKNELGDKKQFIGTAIAEILNLAVGGAIGFAFGGPAGAVIGITVTAGLNVLINKIATNYTPQSKRQLDQIGQSVDLSAMDAYLKFGAPDNSGTPQSILKAKGKASGGYVSTGTYFYAGENGPELVGQVGSRTNVTNQSQFTAGMENIMDNTNSVIMQVGSAVVQAIVNKDMTVINNLSERMIVNAYDRGKKLAGTSAVTGSGLL